MGTPSAWTDELVQKLIDLWSVESAARISAIFAGMGHDISRSAVIGKASRIGLAGQNNSQAEPSGTNPARPAPRRTTPKPAGACAPPVRIIHTPMHLPFEQLTDETCKFECSGQDEPSQYTFCGHPTGPHRRYCAHCVAIVYEKPPAKHRGSLRRAA